MSAEQLDEFMCQHDDVMRAKFEELADKFDFDLSIYFFEPEQNNYMNDSTKLAFEIFQAGNAAGFAAAVMLLESLKSGVQRGGIDSLHNIGLLDIKSTVNYLIKYAVKNGL